MTRKHFKALAAALKDSKPEPPNIDDTHDWASYREAHAQWRTDIRAIAAVFLVHNPRFDDGLFRAACGHV